MNRVEASLAGSAPDAILAPLIQAGLRGEPFRGRIDIEAEREAAS